MRASESWTSRSDVSVPALNAALRSAIVAESRSSVFRAETGARVRSRTAAKVMIRMRRTLPSPPGGRNGTTLAHGSYNGHVNGALSQDTTADAERLQIDHWRAMSPAEKLGLVSAMSRAASALALAGVRDRHPDASSREIFLRFAILHLGVELARKAYPEIVALGLE
jgi:hypothetical protein